MNDDDDDLFRITGPAVVSFSGGRTSAYLLWRILQAYDGKLPDNIVPFFANTGREMPATLDFVRDCSDAWSVPVHWLEFRKRAAVDGYAEVDHASASRQGEPFEMLIADQSALPSPVQRNCTQQLKIATMKRFVQDQLGWKRWTNVIGLRSDEPGRVHRATLNARDQWSVECPLFDAGITVLHVKLFWDQQPFDLKTKGKWEGNCDGCFLKSRGFLKRMIADHPERMEWWARMETTHPGKSPTLWTFRNDRESYSEMQDTVARQGCLPLFDVFEPSMECTEWTCTD